MNYNFINKKTTKITSSCLLFFFFFGFISFLQTNKELKKLSELKKNAIEITYKATSPRGLIGGLTLPASCESNYYHPTGGAWPTPDGYGTNVSSANKLEVAYVKKLSNSWCVRNDMGQQIFLNSDHNNFVNGAPVGVTKIIEGDL
jgi:hypothetical protein